MVKMDFNWTTLCVLFVLGVSGVDADEESVFVMEGDSVTLNTGVNVTQKHRIRWYYGDDRIAQITGDQPKIFTDDQCNNVTERFRDRLKLDNQTGSLTIMNTRTTDSGVYQLQIISIIDEKNFNVTVHSVPAAQRDDLKTESVKEGESVTLHPGAEKNPIDKMTWYFDEILITEITGDQSKICTDDQCKERFRDRLKMNQTGSLTIMNTRNTDSGVYKLEMIIISSITITHTKSFNVTVIAVPDSGPDPDSGLSSAAVAGICAAVVVVLLVTAVVAVPVIYRHRRSRRRRRRHTAVPQDEEDGL